jgi:adenylate cyclase
MAMLLYAITATQTGEDVITRNYVLYMTSNRILVGAEIDKIISILLVTGVLAVALIRAQRLLVRDMIGSTAAHDLSRFVARDVADKVTTSDKAIQPGDGEVRVASVLFTDIEGFSTISEKLGPDRLAKMLNDYFGAMSEVINQFGGTISQYQGDAMLITFNTVKPDADHVANAVRTSIGIQQACRSRDFAGDIPLKTRCGINTGEMLVGAVGSEDQMLFTVHGDEVNVAARLEQLNKQYGTYIMAGENTVKVCADEFAFERVGEITVRGRSSPTEVYVLKV